MLKKLLNLIVNSFGLIILILFILLPIFILIKKPVWGFIACCSIIILGVLGFICIGIHDKLVRKCKT